MVTGQDGRDVAFLRERACLTNPGVGVCRPESGESSDSIAVARHLLSGLAQAAGGNSRAPSQSIGALRRCGDERVSWQKDLTTMKITVLFGLILAATGCDKGSTTAPAADNTKVNERDQHTAALTPGDQGENDVDRTITQKVRQGVMKDDALSITAKNVKIITTNSVVTLRGPVKNEKERSDIVMIATGTDGVKRVDNQLEIAAN